MALNKQLDFYFDHKTFKSLRHNTERVLRRLTINPYSGMNEELDQRDETVAMVLCRRGTKKQIVGWALMDSRQNCQIYVNPKFRNIKDSSEKSLAEHIVLELCSAYPVKGYYVHDPKSHRFWTKMDRKYDRIKKIDSCVY